MKLFSFSLILCALLAFATFAQDKPKPPDAIKDTPRPPVISDALRAKWWKAMAAQAEAQKQSMQAQAQAQTAKEELVKACGEKFTPGPDASGDPICVAPAPKK